MITTPQQMRAALDRQMNPVLVAYRKEVERISKKVRAGDDLTEGERGFVSSVLEDCAESMFNKAAFWLTYMVESHTNAEKEG